MNHSSETEATLKRIRSEVAQRKGIAESSLPVLQKEKPILQKVAGALERAHSKHCKAKKWPKLFRPLRRNQEAIDEELIGSAQTIVQELERLQKLVVPLVAQQSNLQTRSQRAIEQNRELAEKLERLEQAFSSLPGQDSPRAADAVAARLDAFYLAFEDQFRGSRALIKERLADYLPFLRVLQERIPDAVAVDLGCGRGEWLEFLKENGVMASGVDMNQRMVEQCRSLGLQATQGDAIIYLKSLPDASQAIVSGFHIVEHLAFPQLLELLRESFRVLRPGGIAIFETPNPECLRVSTYTFYMDPTHRNPVPLELLSFVATHVGFSSVHIERLHPYCEEGVLQGYGDYAGILTQ